MNNLNLITNLSLLKLGIPRPISAVFWITHKCNSKCLMCNVWNSKDNNEMELDVFEKAFKDSTILRRVNLFSFTGGEPFLKKDLIEFVKTIQKYSIPKEIRFVTNGLCTSKIVSDMQKVLKLSGNCVYNIKLSLDGIGETHDSIRGIRGNYDKVIELIKELEVLNKKYPSKFSLSIGFTATSRNYKELNRVLSLSKEKNLGFFYKPVMVAKKLDAEENSLYLTNDQKDYLKGHHKNIFERIKTMRYNENISYKLYYQYLEKYHDNPSRIIPCYAASASFHIAANWDVFSCIKLNHVIGNIKHKSFDEVWKGREAKEFRKSIKKSKCHCLCSGELVPSLIAHKFPFLLSKKL